MPLSPITPVVIQGPGCIEFDSAIYFFNGGGLTSSLKRETNDTPSEFGNLGKTLKSAMQVHSFTPAGERKNFGKMYPYTHLNLGKRIFNPGGAANKPVKIHTWEDQITITYPRGAMTKSSPMTLSPNKTIFGAMEISCLGDTTKLPTAVDFWKTVGAAGTDVWPVTFDETLVSKEIFHAALGAIAAPFNAISAKEGFEVGIDYGLKPIPCDEVGIADQVLESITTSCKFIPANVTVTDIETVLKLQGANAVKIGQMLGVKGQNIVIASDSLSVTLSNMGVESFEEIFKSSEHRFKQLSLINRITFTAGVMDSFFTITAT